MGELILMKCKSKMEEWIAKEENGLIRTYYIYLSEGEGEQKRINAIKWENSLGKEQMATNFDIRAILQIVEKGGYELEG
ncbi:MAG: hypothetical protein DRP01_01015 [Archaeoglobales archaeon]|nr:MAG: hypothetical protein DRP01_01015 [Archaeoglobales archaeon]